MNKKYRIWDISHNWYLPKEFIENITIDSGGRVWWNSDTKEDVSDKMIVEYAVAKGRWGTDLYEGDVTTNNLAKSGCEVAVIIYDDGPKLRCKCGTIYESVNWNTIEVDNNIHTDPKVMGSVV